MRIPMFSMSNFLSAVVPAAVSLPLATSLLVAPADAQRAPSSGRPVQSAVTMQYGQRATVGNGEVRSYVMLDSKTMAPLEVGVAFSERALEGLPTDGAGHHGQPGVVHEWSLALPEPFATPFQFIDVNWNPSGHEPAGVYDAPHFDFHFYIVSKAERDEIVPANPQYAEQANLLPSGDVVPPFMVQLSPPGSKPVDAAVPKMGVHWADIRSAELQGLLGKPDQFKPFTSTFILGSWNGRFHFWEPMITRAHILAKKMATDAAVRDEVIPLPVPEAYEKPGAYPTAYRILWDAERREYRIALANLEARR